MLDPLATTPRRHDDGAQPLLRILLGTVLRRTRQHQRRTLADVATAARVSMQYLSEIERGRKEASSEILAAICAALRIDLSDLLAGIGAELAADHARRGAVISLGNLRDQAGWRRPVGQDRGDVVCLLAA